MCALSIKILCEFPFPSKNGRGGVVDILGDCGSPDPGSIPGPGPINVLSKIKSIIIVWEDLLILFCGSTFRNSVIGKDYYPIRLL